jgi:hypothetical protein
MRNGKDVSRTVDPGVPMTPKRKTSQRGSKHWTTLVQGCS